MSSASLYVLEIRAFAPWSDFGEMLPAWLSPFSNESVSTPFGELGGNFRGDSRGFALDTDASARLHFSVTLDPAQGAVSNPQVHADPTVGPFMLFGERQMATADPKFDLVAATRIEHGTHFIFHVSGSNPLVPGSPAIDVRLQLDLVSEGPTTLGVLTKLSGDGFPAFEVVLRDPTGQAVFLGGSMPLDKTDLAVMLWGDTDRQLCQSQILINIGENGYFSSMAYASATGGIRSATLEPAVGTPSSVDAWNTQALESLSPSAIPPGTDMGAPWVPEEPELYPGDMGVVEAVGGSADGGMDPVIDGTRPDELAPHAPVDAWGLATDFPDPTSALVQSSSSEFESYVNLDALLGSPADNLQADNLSASTVPMSFLDDTAAGNLLQSFGISQNDVSHAHVSSPSHDAPLCAGAHVVGWNDPTAYQPLIEPGTGPLMFQPMEQQHGDYFQAQPFTVADDAAPPIASWPSSE